MANVAKVVNKGLEIVTDRLKGVGGLEPHHLGWGTGTTAADVLNTGLETPAAEARTECTSSQQQTNTAKDTYRNVGTITCAGAAKVITEVGLFDAATNGNLFARATFSAINVEVGDAIEFTLDAVFDQGA